MHVKQLSYQHDKQAPYFFKDLTFHLEPGKIHALHGKNGVGKTVLLNVLSKKYPSHAVVKGEVGGHENVVLVNQRFDLMIADQFSFMENLKFACIGKYPSVFSMLRKPRFLPGLIERFHIDLSTPAGCLSGGQRQILALLMVLQRPTDVLLLDEPTATLDEVNAGMVFAFFKTLALQRMTLLVVCHDRELIHEHATGLHLQLEMDPTGMRKLSRLS